MTAGLAFGSVLLLVALLAAASLAARRFGLHPEVARKAVHVGLGLYCLALPALFDRPGPVLATCAVAVLLLLVVRYRHQRSLGAGLHGVARESYGEVLFAAAVGLLFVLGHRDPVTYVLPLAILALSDAAAALVGVRYGRATFRVAEGAKSVEGAAIFFLTAWIIAMVLLLLLSDAPRLTVILLGVEIAAYGTLVEGTSWRGWDNFFLPVAIHLVLAHHLGSPPWLLLEGAAFSGLALALMLLAAPRIGLDRHAAVFVATLLATIAFATTAWNVVVPALALGCHLAIDRREDGAAPHLALGLVFVMLSLGWYVLSDLTNATTVFAYNASFGALGVALLAANGRVWPALAVAPIAWAAVESRAVFDGGVNTPTDAPAMAVLMAVLFASAVIAGVARRRGPVACQRLGGLALAAGAAVFPFAQ